MDMDTEFLKPSKNIAFGVRGIYGEGITLRRIRIGPGYSDQNVSHTSPSRIEAWDVAIEHRGFFA